MVHDKIKNNPMYGYLLMLTVASTAGLQGWRTLFNNFAVEEAGVNGLWVGIIQSVREVPGFLALLVIYILFVLKEHKLSSWSIIVLGVGTAMTGFFPNPIGLAITTFIMSTGFHYYETTNQSLTLQYFPSSYSANVMASFRSISALVNIAVGACIWLLSSYLSMKTLFLLVGIFVAVIGFNGLTRDPVDHTLPPQHKKMILRKKYWLFYTLNLLSGARRQIFMVFAVFLLVEHYQYSVKLITLLFVLNNIINYFFNPLVAKGINRFGERAILSMEYGSLIFIFLAYAFIENPIVAGILYVLDHIVFNFAIGIKTYFQKTADPRDIAPSMAVSFTINHITAVFLPFVGGMLWMIDRRIPFVGGAILAVISLLFVQKIRTGEGK